MTYVAFILPFFTFIKLCSLASYPGVLQDTSVPFDAYGPSLIYSTTVDTNGNLYVAGQFDGVWKVVGYLPNGQRNPSFGNNGVAIDGGENSGVSRAWSITMDYQNRLLVVGQATYPGTEELVLTITRYNSNGTVQQSHQEVSVPGLQGLAGIVYNSFNDFIVSGYQLNGNAPTVAFSLYYDSNMVRYNFQAIPSYTAGTQLDRAISTLVSLDTRLIVPSQGMLQDTALPFSPTDAGLVYSTTVAHDGTLLAATFSQPNTYIINYLTNATRNPSFGTGSSGVTTAVNSARWRAITTDSNGNIFVGGTALIMANNVWSMARYSPTGTLNTILAELSLGVGTVLGITMNSDNTLVAVGSTTVAGQDCPTVIDYNNDLTATSTRQFTVISPGFFYGYQTSGHSQFAAGATDDKALLYELLDGNGLLQDTNPPFNTGEQAMMYGSITDRDGNIVLCGEYNNIFTVIRYTSTGERDTTFGDGNGVAHYESLTPSIAYNLVQDNAGNYFVTGYVTVSSTPVLALLNYNNDGTLNTSFGTQGVAHVRTLGQSVGYGIALNTHEGSILVAGQVTNDAQQVPAFVLYDGYGNLVYRFGIQGVQTFNQYGAGSLRGVITNQQLQATGVGGIDNLGSNDSIATIIQVGQGTNVIQQIETGF